MVPTDRKASPPVPASVLLRLGAALLVLSLGACTPVYEMAQSTTAAPSRPLFSDEGERAEAPPPPEEERETGTGSTGGGETTTESIDAIDIEVAAGAMPSMAEPAAPEDTDGSAHTRSTVAATSDGSGAGSVYVPPNVGGWAPVEPLPWEPLDPAPMPAGPRRVLLATMEVPPGRSIFPPVSSCQDVLVYVQQGSLEAMGTGVGSTDAPTTLYAGDAARFGAEGDGRLTNRTGDPARALVIIARAADAGAPLYTAPVDVGLCVRDEASDPLVRTMRLASTATTPALSVGDALTVRILLDVDGHAAEHAGLALLEGTAAFTAAPHSHAASDEVLFVEEGDGLLHLGSAVVPVHDGAVLYIPAGVEHSFEPSGTSPFRAIQVYAPSGPEQRFRGLAGAP